MPGGDGTGPLGAGPMTGRAAGFCAGYGMPGYANPIAGRGFGRGMGRGRGRGFGRGFGRGWQFSAPWAAAPGYGAYAPPPAPSAEQEAGTLKAQAEHLEAALGEIRKRLDELTAAKSEG